MKVLWVTFAPIGHTSELFYHTTTQSGGWVDATLKRFLPFLQDGSVSLEVAALAGADGVIRDEETGVVYRTVNLPRYRGKRGNAADVAKWRTLLDEVKPDIIHVWGTEFTFGLDILDAAGDIPVCFYIQGVMSSVAAHPAGDVPLRTLRRMLGPTVAFKMRSMKRMIRCNDAHLVYERQMIARTAGVLGDNEWAEAQYHTFTDKFYTVPLALDTCFQENQWTLDACARHTLFTIAGGACPQKGVHNAVLAVAKLKKTYPDIRLCIPGNVTYKKPHFLYDSVYIRHLRKLIEQYGLQENVVFLGSLKPQQMAEQMRSAHCFVMPSCVETHSSSLREAMMQGCPAISATVGSATEFVTHGKNGFLYRYGEADTLAYYIDKIFRDDALAASLGATAREDINARYPQEQVGQMLFDAYQAMMENRHA